MSFGGEWWAGTGDGMGAKLSHHHTMWNAKAFYPFKSLPGSMTTHLTFLLLGGRQTHPSLSVLFIVTKSFQPVNWMVYM